MSGDSEEAADVQQLAEDSPSAPSPTETSQTTENDQQIEQVAESLTAVALEDNTQLTPLEDSDDLFNSMLPEEIVTYIFSMLSINDLLNVQTVCRKWLEFGRSDAIWNILYDETEWSIPFSPEYEVETWYEVYQMRSRYETEQLGTLFILFLFFIFFISVLLEQHQKIGEGEFPKSLW
jgi:hypothetical protein